MFWDSIYKQYIEGRLTRAILNRNFSVVENYLNRKERVHETFRVTHSDNALVRGDLFEVEFSPHHIAIRIGATEVHPAQVIADRLPELSSLFMLCRHGGANGKVLVSLDDSDSIPSVAFCSSFADSLLIPDFEYLRTHAYSGHEQIVKNHAPDWSHRRPMAIWRGTTTGNALKGDWRSLPRVQLCEIASQRPDLFDVGISSITRLENAVEAARELASKKLMRDFMKAERWVKYKYHIDIDGHSNAWSGFFTKLMTGSPVLKVASISHFRQWYYDRLEPFVNFVPVQTDMSDLTEKLLWLQANDDKAHAIGQAGRALVLSLVYETELAKARDAIISITNGN